MHQLTCVYTPQQNEVVERKHRHLLEVARALHFQSGLLISFWGECVLTVAYIINYTPTPNLQGKTPYELLFYKPPTSTHLRVFGCLCYAHEVSKPRDKFHSRSARCIFIGYPYSKKGYRVYDLITKKIFISRDVVFYEDQFPFLKDMKIPNEPHTLPIIPLPIHDETNSTTQLLGDNTDTTNDQADSPIIIDQHTETTTTTTPPAYL